MADDLERWAARRAPELLRRAEAEAVAALRDALVEAAVGRQSRAPRPVEPVAQPDSGDALWAYCVLPADDPVPPDLVGVVAQGPVERVDGAGLAALISRVPRAEFGEEPLRRNLNDLAWLERVARAHETVLERTLTTATIVPLRMCTLYESEESVRRMLEREREPLGEALRYLTDRQEWGVKVVVDPETLAGEARARNPEAADLEDDLDARTAGSAYMLRRRLERRVRELADALAAEISEEVDARVRDCAIDAVTRPPQNRDLSGHEGDMIVNAAYLVEAGRVDELHRLVTELEERHSGLGVGIELTGPWPPYNFVPGEPAGALT